MLAAFQTAIAPKPGRHFCFGWSLRTARRTRSGMRVDIVHRDALSARPGIDVIVYLRSHPSRMASQSQMELVRVSAPCQREYYDVSAGGRLLVIAYTMHVQA